MAKSTASIRFEPKPLRKGLWLVTVTFPDRTPETISNFPTEFDAKNWITNDSEVWLKKLGYGDE